MAGQWSALPPEVNAGQLMAGDQGASIAAAAAAYEALAAALMAEGAKMAATAGVTAATGWVGVGGTAMMATAMPYVAALEAARRLGTAVGGLRRRDRAGVRHGEDGDDPGAGLQHEPQHLGRSRQRRTSIGITPPPMGVLDTEYYGHFWTQQRRVDGRIRRDRFGDHSSRWASRHHRRP